jgi:hypothetical protein
VNKISLFLLLISVLFHFHIAGADDAQKPPGKKWTEKGSEKNINAGRIKKERTALPSWLPEEDRKAWKNGRPPGWDRGRKTGWQDGNLPPGWDRGRKTGWQDGNLPPGHARKMRSRPEHAPRSWHQWTEQERNRYEEQIKNAERRIRELLEKKGSLPGKMLDSATLSLFSSAGMGVPVPTTSSIIEQGIERGLSPEGIEQVTRALSYGAERQADFVELEKIIRTGMDSGLTDDELTMEVYRALSK